MSGRARRHRDGGAAVLHEAPRPDGRARSGASAGPEGSVRLLRWCVVGLLALCAAVFLAVTLFVMRSSDTTIDEISGGFMEQMSAQIRLNFQSEVRLYRSKLESVLLSVECDGGATGAERRATCVDEAKQRGFRYVAILDGDETSVLMGPDLALDGRDDFVRDTLTGDDVVTVGISDAGETMIVLSRSLPRADGSDESGGNRVLVAGVPIAEAVEALSLDVSTTEVYTHIIRADGSFILNNNSSLHNDSYLELLRLNEGRPGIAYDITADRLKAIMDAGDCAFYVSNINGERYASYLAPLEGTNWFIVSVLPFRVLRDPIEALAWNLFAAGAVGCVLILVALAFVLTRYLRVLNAQMDALAEAREQADAASRAKSEFLSNMSHDIRTPMNAIVGMTRIARDESADEATVRRCLDTISTSSTHLLGLINDVLDMSRIESGRLEFVLEPARLTDIVRAAEGVIRPQADARGQDFKVELCGVACDAVLVDRTRLGQVLINLLSNAVKFTPVGGSVLLAVEQRSCMEGAGTGDETGQCGEGSRIGPGDLVRTRLIVRDTGIGMSEEFQSKVFGSFERETAPACTRPRARGWAWQSSSASWTAWGEPLRCKAGRARVLALRSPSISPTLRRSARRLLTAARYLLTVCGCCLRRITISMPRSPASCWAVAESMSLGCATAARPLMPSRPPSPASLRPFSWISACPSWGATMRLAPFAGLIAMTPLVCLSLP